MSISAGCLGRMERFWKVEYSTLSTVTVACVPKGRANMTGYAGSSGNPTSPWGVQPGISTLSQALPPPGWVPSQKPGKVTSATICPRSDSTSSNTGCEPAEPPRDCHSYDSPEAKAMTNGISATRYIFKPVPPFQRKGGYQNHLHSPF